MSVQRAQSEMSSSEFVEWIIYLDGEVNGFHREDYFFANIVAEIRRWNVKDPKEPKAKDHLIEFSFKKKVIKRSIEESSKFMKRFWGSVLSLPQKLKGKKNG